jgi:hypothetical protein
MDSEDETTSHKKVLNVYNQKSLKARITSLVENSVFDMGLDCLQMGRDSGTMFATWSACLKQACQSAQ